MGSRVLIIGVGDMARQIAHWLAASPQVSDICLASRSTARGEALAALVASCHPCRVKFATLDGTRQDDVAALIEGFRPDLILQNASLLSPWALVGRDDAKASAFNSVGLGPMLPAQLPVLLNVMRAVRDTGFEGPVVNLSLPDITNPVLARLGLAPTIGLGNAGMTQLRVRAVLLDRDDTPVEDLPLVRVVAHHSQIGITMRSALPANPEERVRVYLGDEGIRADELAYAAPPLEKGVLYNVSTTAASVPVLLSLLADGDRIRVSVPGFDGLPGGYPVTIARGRVDLDLPAGVDLSEAVEFNERMARHDGIESIDDDGTVHFTQAANDALSVIDPDLTAPLHPQDAWPRYERLREALKA